MPRSCSDAFYFHLVFEYLVHMGMDATSRRMLEECDLYGYPVPYLSESGVSMEEITRLLQNFDDENCADFFKEFEMAVPISIQNSNDCRKLKLGLHVYFAVAGLRCEMDVPPPSCSLGPDKCSNEHPANEGNSLAEPGKRKNCNTSCPCKNPHCMCRSDGGIAEEKTGMKSRKYGKENRPDNSRQLAHPCMATLLAFLERDGCELSKEGELLPYFALPFILDPEAHPHYEHLFKPPWATNLRRWLWNFLISHRQASRVPELVLLLPDLHTALSGRNGRGISSMMPRNHNSCPTSDHEICMNHVTSNMHGGKTRLRQYYPKDPNCTVKLIETTPNKKVVREEEEVTDTAKKPVTFQRELSKDEEKEGSAGVQERPTWDYSEQQQQQQQQQEQQQQPQQQGLDDCNPQTCLLYGSLRSRYNQLHNDYHNLLGIAAELTDALENCVRGENVDLKRTLENCSLLFPELMKLHENVEPSDRAKKTPAQPPKREEKTPKVEEQTTNRDEATPKKEKTEIMVIFDDTQKDVPKPTESRTLQTVNSSQKLPGNQNKARFDRKETKRQSTEINPMYTESMGKKR